MGLLAIDEMALITADALPAVQSMLQFDPQMNAALCVVDDGRTGATQVFEAACIDLGGVYLAGWGGASPTLQQILDGGHIKTDADLDLKEIRRSIVYSVDSERTVSL